MTARDDYRALAELRSTGSVHGGPYAEIGRALREIDRLRARVSELEAAARTPEDDAVLQAADEWFDADDGSIGLIVLASAQLSEAIEARREALGASQ